MMLQQIRLELTPSQGYEFIAPLDGRARIATAYWPKAKGACIVHRFVPCERDRYGTLIQTRTGSWAFSYDVGESDDEALPGFEKQSFTFGATVKVRQQDGVTRTFSVVRVGPAIEREGN